MQGRVLLAEQLKARRSRLVTTRAVILEIGNALAKARYRHAGIALLDSLELDPSVEIVPLSEQLYERAYKLFRERPDNEWGITDCISFVVMENRALKSALTTDDHFAQAGFPVLLQQGP